MTLAQLTAAAERDATSSEPRRIMAGVYARHAVTALDRHDWAGAEHYLLQAIRRDPATYAPALQLVERCRGGAVTSEAKAEASRINGKRGGRPRKLATETGQGGQAVDTGADA